MTRASGGGFKAYKSNGQKPFVKLSKNPKFYNNRSNVTKKTKPLRDAQNLSQNQKVPYRPLNGRKNFPPSRGDSQSQSGLGQSQTRHQQPSLDYDEDGTTEDKSFANMVENGHLDGNPMATFFAHQLKGENKGPKRDKTSSSKVFNTFSSNDPASLNIIGKQVMSQLSPTDSAAVFSTDAKSKKLNVLFDSGANVNLTGNLRILTRTKKIPGGHSISSSEDSQPLVASHVGVFDNSVPVCYSSQARADVLILSRSVLKSWGRVWYSEGHESDREDVISDGVSRDYFKPTNSSIVWIFEERTNGLPYLSSKLDYDSFLKECRQSATSDAAYTTMLETVKSNTAKFSVREIKAATQARQVADALSNMNARQIAASINSGNILSDTTTQDFLRADLIFGPSEAEAKGKRKQMKITSEPLELYFRPLSLQK
jgi:hypothetical protein